MKELGPIAKLLVESAREGLGPDDAAIARVRGRVATAVATGAAATTAGAASAKAAVGAKAVVGAATVKTAAGIAGAKLVAIAVVASVAVGGGVVVATRGGGEPAHVAPAPQHVASAPAPRPAPAPSPAPPVEQPPPPADEPPPAPAASIPIPPPAPHHAPKPAPVAPPPAREPATLAREVTLLDDATSALRNGHPADAIATIKIYQRETAGQGQMAQDVAALELEALCALHAPEVPAKLAVFDQRWPKSAERARIAAACR
jgi:hypothetical protein